MKVTRRGSERNRGEDTIIRDVWFNAEGVFPWESNVGWDTQEKNLIIHARNIPHTDGVTHHNYTVILTLEDISSLIGLLGCAASASDARLLRDHLREHAPAIVKLLACAMGVAPVPIETNASYEEEGS